MQRVLIAAIAVCLFYEGFSQSKDPARLWTQSIGRDTQWLYTSPDGTLIAATPDRLVGINQSTGNTMWTFTSTQLPSISYLDTIPGLPYLTLRNVPLTIIDPSNGHAVFDAVASGITRIYKYGFLASGHLWVDGIFGGIRSLSLIELRSGKMIWNRYDYFADPDRSDLNKVKQLTTRAAFPARLLSTPINDQNNIIFASGDGLYFNYLFKVRIDDGNVVWKINAPDPNRDKLMKMETNTSFFKLFPKPDHFFFARNNWMTSCSYDNGEAIWKTPVKTHGEPSMVVYDSVVITQDPILETTTVNLPIPYKIKGMIHNMEVTNSGLFYITDRSVNIIDVVNLKELINIPPKVIVANALDNAYAFSKEDHNLYEINKQKGTAHVLNKDRIRFKILDNPDHIQVVKDGVVLYSEKSITFINVDGTTRYVVNYSALWDPFFDAKPVYTIDAETGRLFHIDKNSTNLSAYDIQGMK